MYRTTSPNRISRATNHFQQRLYAQCDSQEATLNHLENAYTNQPTNQHPDFLDSPKAIPERVEPASENM